MLELANEDATNWVIYFFLIYPLTNFSIFTWHLHCCSTTNEANYLSTFILSTKTNAADQSQLSLASHKSWQISAVENRDISISDPKNDPLKIIRLLCSVVH